MLVLAIDRPDCHTEHMEGTREPGETYPLSVALKEIMYEVHVPEEFIEETVDFFMSTEEVAVTDEVQAAASLLQGFLYRMEPVELPRDQQYSLDEWRLMIALVGDRRTDPWTAKAVIDYNVHTRDVDPAEMLLALQSGMNKFLQRLKRQAGPAQQG